MKPGKRDIKVFIKFTEDELEILQANTFHMAESFGLDRRIEKLTGKRKVGFYMWDLECIECAITFIVKDKDYFDDIDLIRELHKKIIGAMNEIENSQN